MYIIGIRSNIWLICWWTWSNCTSLNTTARRGVGGQRIGLPPKRGPFILTFFGRRGTKNCWRVRRESCQVENLILFDLHLHLTGKFDPGKGRFCTSYPSTPVAFSRSLLFLFRSRSPSFAAVRFWLTFYFLRGSHFVVSCFDSFGQNNSEFPISF